MNPRHPEIEALWELRFAQAIPETRRGLEEMFTRAETLAPRDRAELFLLRASLERHERRLDWAQASMDLAQQELARAGERTCFQFEFQKGLCLDAESKPALALQYYQRACRIAGTPEEKLMAKYNTSIAMFNLDLPSDGLFGEIREILAEEVRPAVRKGAEFIELRQRKREFHRGNFAEALRAPPAELNQSLYFSAWLSSLPWLEGKQSPVRADFLVRALGNEALFEKEYRLQTLNPDPRIVATGEGSLPSQVDRLYLWGWMWIERPTAQLRALLEREFSIFPFDTAHMALTSEDFYLLHSLGGWLGLFHEGFAEQFSKWIAKYAADHLTNLPPFFRADQAAIAAVRENRYAAFVRAAGLDHPELAPYFQFLDRVQKKVHARTGGAQPVLVVDGLRQTITRDGSVVHSAPLTRLLLLAMHQPTTHFSEALRECFGLPNFDPLTHAPKIQNLIQRAKALLPLSAELTTKNGYISFRDPENKVCFTGSYLHQRHFPRVEFTLTEAPVHPRTEQTLDGRGFARVLHALKKKRALTRTEIQGTLGLSKSASARVIAEWVQKGRLARIGQGRQTRYEIGR